MSTTIMHNNPLIDPRMVNPDVVVVYDTNKALFYVTFIATNSGYAVKRGDLVTEDFKYMDSIISEILSGCETDDDLSVLFTHRAYNEVYMIWMANCDIF